MRRLHYFILLLFYILITFSNGYCDKIYATNLNKIRLIEKSLQRFKEDVGRYPSTEEGLSSLIDMTNLKGWRGPYLPIDKVILDSWNKEFIYFYPPKYGNKEFDLYSAGKNLIDNSGEADDITNWKGYNKWVYEKNESIKDLLIRTIFFISLVCFIYLLRKRRKKE